MGLPASARLIVEGGRKDRPDRRVAVLGDSSVETWRSVFGLELRKIYCPEFEEEKVQLISKFIEEERPYFENIEAMVSATDSEFVDPDKADSTELGEVPQQAQQGSIRPGYVRDPYSFSYMYTV